MSVEHMLSLLTVIGAMMLVIGLGALAERRGFFSIQGRKELTELVINLIFPCYVLNGFIKNIGVLSGGDALAALALAVVIQAAVLAVNPLLFRRTPQSRRSVLRYAAAVSNSAFLGLPLVESVFGSPGLVYASIFVIPQRINCFGVAVNYFLPSGGGTLRDRLRGVLTQPSILATMVGIVMMLTGLRPPSLITEAISTVAACSTPMCMLMVGVMIASCGERFRPDRPTAGITLLRLAVIPLCIFVPLRLLGMSRVVTGTAVLLSAMPAGTTTALLADRYGMDAGFASRVVLVTTLAGLLTIPLWSYLCLYA